MKTPLPPARLHLWTLLLLSVWLATGCNQPLRLVPTLTPASGAVTPQFVVEPLVPTALAPTAAPSPLATPHASTVTAVQTPPPPAPPLAPPLPEPYSLRWRVGIGVPDGKSPLAYGWPEMRPGWYLNWSAGFTATQWVSDTSTLELVIPPDEAAGMAFVPMVRTPGGELKPPPEVLAQLVTQLPGRTWLIGNEPDVRWQDNATPAEYAQAYHLAYTTIKQADPTASVAIGGVSQITPLRLAYLDQVLDAYQSLYGEAMPVDVWNMHAFVLQERAGDWGVDIPPGMTEVTEGQLWQIEDHADLALVEEQVRAMRRWMAAHGQREKPLWITEYGILMPASYGFPPDVVGQFLVDSYDLFDGLRDPDLGYRADDDRLVQRWVWFSAGFDLYPTGNLFHPDGALTELMPVLARYLAEQAP